MIYTNYDKGLKVIVDGRLLDDIRRKAVSCWPNEAGGLLVGWIDDGKVAHVGKQLAPAKEVATRTSYFREVAGMDELWKELYQQGLIYLGEWHSHPNGSAKYSAIDHDAIKRVFEDDGVVLSKPLMLIVGVDNGAYVRDAMYVYDGKNKEIIKMERKVELKELFAGLKAEMQESLNVNRTSIPHYATMGAASEVRWSQFLRDYLPKKYLVDNGIVIDCEGNVSEQIDIIIYDALYTPFVFNKDGVKLIPAESVYAVFEAKQDAAQNDNIKYAGQKVETVRRLKRTSTKIVNAGVTTKARNLTKIIGGILALEYSSKQETLEKHLKSLKGLQSLDCGCFLKNFTFDCKYEGKEDIVGREQVNVEDYYNGRSCKEVVFNSEENLLFAFFFQLNSYLKKIGTIPAIDINAYLQTIGVTVDEE